MALILLFTEVTSPPPTADRHDNKRGSVFMSVPDSTTSTKPAKPQRRQDNDLVQTNPVPVYMSGPSSNVVLSDKNRPNDVETEQTQQSQQEQPKAGMRKTMLNGLKSSEFSLVAACVDSGNPGHLIVN